MIFKCISTPLRTNVFPNVMRQCTKLPCFRIWMRKQTKERNFGKYKNNRQNFLVNQSNSWRSKCVLKRRHQSDHLDGFLVFSDACRRLPTANISSDLRPTIKESGVLLRFTSSCYFEYIVNLINLKQVSKMVLTVTKVSYCNFTQFSCS